MYCLIISSYLHSIILVREHRWSKRMLNVFVQPAGFLASGEVLQRFGFWDRGFEPLLAHGILSYVLFCVV